MPAVPGIVGSITAPGSTGNQTYTLPSGSGTPKALILWWTEQTADGAVSNALFSFGFSTYRSATVAQLCNTTGSADAAASADTGSLTPADATAVLLDPGTQTRDGEVDTVSFALDEFVLNWVNLPGTASTLLNYLVITDKIASDALAHSYSVGTGGTTQDVTVASGFGRPDLVIFTYRPCSSGAALWGGLGVGVGLKDGGAEAAVLWDQEGAGNMIVNFWQQGGVILGLDHLSDGVEDSESGLSASSAWPTDGYQLNKINLPSASHSVYALAVKFQPGVTATILNALDNPTAGSPPIAEGHIVGFPPHLAFFFGGTIPDTGTTPNTNHADLGGFWVGAADGTNEVMAGISQEDSATNANTYSYRSDDQAVEIWNPNDGTLLAEADVSFDSSSVILTWQDIDATARAFRGLVVGIPVPQLVAGTFDGGSAMFGQVSKSTKVHRVP